LLLPKRSVMKPSVDYNFDYISEIEFTSVYSNAGEMLKTARRAILTAESKMQTWKYPIVQHL
jgi:hypothetical protein